MLWISKPHIPLTGYAELGQRRAYKVFLADVGLLGGMSNLPARVLLEGSALFDQYKWALTEQCVCQQLISEFGRTPFYWSAHSGSAALDFVVQDGETICGIEVESAENLQSKCLRIFHNAYPDTNAVRFSLAPYRRENWMGNVPLYTIQNMELWAAQKTAASSRS